MVSPIGNSVKESWTNLIKGVSGIKSYLNDPVLKNDKPYNLALIKDFDYKKWKVPVITYIYNKARQQPHELLPTLRHQ
jgi:hypothetical protein